MSLEQKLIQLEERFRRGGADVYRQGLADEALMVFPAPFGIMERAPAIAAVEHAPGWRAIEFQDQRVLELSPDSAVLVYRGDARHEDGSSYDVDATSAYVRRGGRWQLVLHQQTPISDG